MCIARSEEPALMRRDNPLVALFVSGRKWPSVAISYTYMHPLEEEERPRLFVINGRTMVEQAVSILSW